MLANVILTFTCLDCLKMTVLWIKHVATHLYNATTINTTEYYKIPDNYLCWL